MRSRFARIRVRPAHRDYWRSESRPEEWLLIEWPRGEKGPSKAWLSNVSTNASFTDLVHLAKIRWRVERDYQNSRTRSGIDHYRRSRLGGASTTTAPLCIAAYAFLIAERARLSPPTPLAFLQAPPVPRGFRPRGSPATP